MRYHPNTAVLRRKERLRQLTQTLTMTVAAMVLALHLAHASMRDTITTVDDQGMVTI
jgi:hypothetical protein